MTQNKVNRIILEYSGPIASEFPRVLLVLAGHEIDITDKVHSIDFVSGSDEAVLWGKIGENTRGVAEKVSVSVRLAKDDTAQ